VAVIETEGYFGPARFEAEVFDCHFTGAIPKDLDGAFFRMHAASLYPPKFADDTILAADGYISMFRIQGGHVDYRGRYVRTQRMLNQKESRRQLYGYYRNPYTDDPEVRDVDHPHLRTTANTTAMVLAGKLYANKEDGLPHELDPNSLETIGPTDFNGDWQSQTFTAHPKRDPVTGETFVMGYEAHGLASDDVHVGSFDREGALNWVVRFKVPYPSLLHDMIITEDYVVIPGGGTVTSRDRLEAGKIHWGWDGTLPFYYAVVPRGGENDDIRWFYSSQRGVVHTANGWNEGRRIFLDMPMADGNVWPWFEDLQGAPFEPIINSLRRVTLDLDDPGEHVDERVIIPTPISHFTRIDERRLGRKHRYVWVNYADPEQTFTGTPGPGPEPTGSILRVDMADGSTKSFSVGSAHVCQEPIFVPRSAHAPEGDGFVLATAHNLDAMRAELVILDAMEMVELARVILPFRNPEQVHGTWAEAAELPFR
jgi:carotenoid cleavage dioxygenase